MDIKSSSIIESNFFSICVTSIAEEQRNFVSEMVCIPCFIVPVLLFIWHRFIQPYVLRYWNPWAKKDADGNVINTPENTKFPIDCTGGKCIFKPKGNAANKSDDATPTANPHPIAAEQPVDKKND